MIRALNMLHSLAFRPRIKLQNFALELGAGQCLDCRLHFFCRWKRSNACSIGADLRELEFALCFNPFVTIFDGRQIADPHALLWFFPALTAAPFATSPSFASATTTTD